MSTLPLATAVVDPTLEGRPRTGTWDRVRAQVARRPKARTVYALGDQVVYSFGNMVVAAFISRHCAARDFGVYILTQRVLDVLIQLCNVFLWAPLTFRLPATPQEHKAHYQGGVFLVQAFCCVLFTASLWAAAHWTARTGHAELHDTFAALIGAAGGIVLREFTRRMYFAHMRLREAFWTETATVLLQIAGVEWLYQTGRLTVPTALAVLCAGAAAVSLWWILREGRLLQVDRRSLWADLRQDFRLGRWFFGGNMVFLASAQCNPWVLSSSLGGAAVGSYAIAESLVNIPRVALTSMQNVMGPMLAEAHLAGGTPQVHREVQRFNRKLLATSGLFALGLWACAPLVARLIYRNVPGNTRVVVLLLATNLVVYACTLAQAYGLTALGRPSATFYANGVGLLAQAAASLYLVRSFHVPGAAAATLFGSLVVLVMRQWLYSREVARG